MRLFGMYMGIVILGVTLSSCAPSSPSTLEVLNSLEASLVDRDKNGTLALFAKNAVILGPGGQPDYDGIAQIEVWADAKANSTQSMKFKDINLEGDTAMFILAEVGTLYTENLLFEMEVQDGKIQSLHLLELLESTRTGED